MSAEEIKAKELKAKAELKAQAEEGKQAGAEGEVITDEKEFDDWYNDPEAEGDELENQAAAFRNADNVYEVDPRTARYGDGLKECTVRFAGQCYFKYKDADGKSSIKKGSGHIVKDLEGGKFVMLTAQHVARGKGKFEGGFFFLQRFGVKGFAAKFKIEGIDDLAHHEDWSSGEDQNKLSGTDISAVRITFEEGELPEGIPELEEQETLDANVECTFSGYPKQKWVKGELVDNKFGLYSSSSLHDEEGASENGIGPTSDSQWNSVCGFSMDTSVGQEGGALVHTKTGAVIGILYGVGPLEGTEFSLATVMTEKVVNWVKDQFA